MSNLKIDDEIRPLHNALIDKDVNALRACLADDVVFRPPTYWKDWPGRDVVSFILATVSEVFIDFEYTRIFNDNPNYALEFKTKVGDLDAEGVDLIRLNSEGLVEEFTVVMRPLKTVAALREEMAKRAGGMLK